MPLFNVPKVVLMLAHHTERSMWAGPNNGALKRSGDRHCCKVHPFGMKIMWA